MSTKLDALVEINGADASLLNEFDRKRVEMALQRRERYRYVRPKVSVVNGGLRIESPCCSRRIDDRGGTIDIALVQCGAPGVWNLFQKDHSAGEWKLYGTYARLTELLETLRSDPERVFWQ